MRVLVTGAAGFIGYHLSERLLARGRDAQQPVTDVLARHITDTFRGEMRRLDRAA